MRIDHTLIALSPRGGTRLTRRTALQGAGALGLVGVAGGRVARRARAQDASPTATDLAAYPETAFIANDFSYDGLPATIAGGWVKLTMTNDGLMDHHAIVLKLNEGVTAEEIDALAAQPDAFQFLQVGEAIGGPGSVGPGESSTVILELTPGEYRLICIIPDEADGGIPHYMKGMISPLTVTEATTELAAPEGARQFIALIDFAFDDFAPQQPTGEQLWQVANVGQELHEFVIFKQAPGVTYEMVEGIFGIGAPMASPAAEAHDMAGMGTPEGDAAMGSPAADAPMGPPFVAVAGVAPYLPDFINWTVVDLAPGDYFAICFVPSFANGGAPHFALGMIAPFTVA